MRVVLAMIGLVLGMASANAAEVISAGGTVLSGTGLPVTVGGTLVEPEHEGRSNDTGDRGGRGESEGGGECGGNSD